MIQLSQFHSNVIVGAFFLFLVVGFWGIAKVRKDRRERFEKKREEYNEFKKEFYKEEQRITKEWD